MKLLLKKRIIRKGLLAGCAVLILAGCGFFRSTAPDEQKFSEPAASDSTSTNGTSINNAGADNFVSSSDAQANPAELEQDDIAPTEDDTVNDQGTSFDQYAMLVNILNNAVLPANARFEGSTIELQAALRSLRDEPSMDTLAAAQASWRTASGAWAECDLFGSRELTIFHNQIDKWPTNIEFVEGFIGDNLVETLDAEFAASIGSTSKGLPAIEYLLFPADGNNDRILAELVSEENGHRRLDYLVALGDNLNQNAVSVNRFWLGDERDDDSVGAASAFLNADPATVDTHVMLSLIMNGISEQLEDNLQRRLWGVIQQQLGMEIEVESPYAQHSVLKLSRSVESFLRAYRGGDSADTLGLDDYLDHLDVTYNAKIMSAHVQTPTPDEVDTPLSELIVDRANAMLQLLAQIDEPLAEAIVEESELLNATNAAAHKLLLPVRVDMNNKFGVTISFNDGD